MGRPGHDTKQTLIDTALELIWKSSYGSVSVDDICKAAGALRRRGLGRSQRRPGHL